MNNWRCNDLRLNGRIGLVTGATLFKLLLQLFATLLAGFRALLRLLVQLGFRAQQLDVGHLAGITLAGTGAGNA